MTHHAMSYYRAPPALAARIRAGLPGADQSSATLPASWRWRVRPAQRWILSVAAAAACLMLGWNLALQMDWRGAPTLAEQVVDDHVRSLMADHLMDVASSDQNGVLPWFSGKLDLATPAGDYPDQGFTLLGGRLDYLGGRTVPALVYRHNEHIINMFVLPDGGKDESPTHLATRGYALATWRKAGLTYWAVCDMSASELDKLATLTMAAAD